MREKGKLSFEPINLSPGASVWMPAKIVGECIAGDYVDMCWVLEYFFARIGWRFSEKQSPWFEYAMNLGHQLYKGEASFVATQNTRHMLNELISGDKIYTRRRFWYGFKCKIAPAYVRFKILADVTSMRIFSSKWIPRIASAAKVKGDPWMRSAILFKCLLDEASF